MTPTEAAFLATARRVAATRIGWTGPTNQIPYEKREEYATALAEVIMAYPARFDPQTVSIARAELTDRANSPLGDYTVVAAGLDFFGEAFDEGIEIAAAVGEVGEGVKNTLSLASWVLPVAGLVVVVLLLKGFARRTA